MTATVKIPAARPPAQAVNWFHFATSGGGVEIQLLMGYVDPQLVHENRVQIETGRAHVEPEVTLRLMLSARGLILLRQQVNSIFGKLSEQGFLSEVSEVEETDE